MTFTQNRIWAIEQFALRSLIQKQDRPQVRERHEPQSIMDRARYAVSEHDVVMGCNDRITYERMDSVAIIRLCGVIGKDISEWDEMFGWTDIGQFCQSYTQAQNDPNVFEILIDFKSPGGDVTGVPEAGALIASGSNRSGGKRTFAWTDTMAQSGAYWLASQCDVIACSQSSMLGSIGVYCALVDQSKAWEMEGLKMDLVRSGKFKGSEMSGLPIDPEYREEIQKQVDAIGINFREAIKSARPGVNDSAMEGLSYRGADSTALGLADMTYNSIADYHRDIVASRR